MEQEEKSLNFIEQIVEKDLSEGKNDGRIQTRVPPEPNGYLHIGHVKAICMDTTDMQVAVGFGRETRLNTSVVLAFTQVFLYDLLNKIETFFLLFHVI